VEGGGLGKGKWPRSLEESRKEKEIMVSKNCNSCNFDQSKLIMHSGKGKRGLASYSQERRANRKNLGKRNPHTKQWMP